MTWICELTALIGEGTSPTVVEVQRTAVDPWMGLQLCWMELLTKVSTVDAAGAIASKEVVLMGWACKEAPGTRGADAITSQRLLDRSRNAVLSAHAAALNPQKGG